MTASLAAVTALSIWTTTTKCWSALAACRITRAFRLRRLDRQGRLAAAVGVGLGVGGRQAQDGESVLKGLADFRGADMIEELGLIVQGPVKILVGLEVIDVELFRQCRHDGLSLNPELGSGALDTQRQGVIDVIGHRRALARRSGWPVAAPHLGDRPAEAHGGQHVCVVLARELGVRVLQEQVAGNAIR